MTSQEIASLVASIGLPCAYDHFTEADTPGGPPFICFTYPESDHFAADDKVYQRIRRLRIELYTDNKDPLLEQRVEEALDAADLFYASDESWIESEQMYLVAWSTEVLMS